MEARKERWTEGDICSIVTKKRAGYREKSLYYYYLEKYDSQGRKQA